ncbi:MAG: hypothetical protein QM757_38680 [Paludibaculum sp.]
MSYFTLFCLEIVQRQVYTAQPEKPMRRYLQFLAVCLSGCLSAGASVTVLTDRTGLGRSVDDLGTERPDRLTACPTFESWGATRGGFPLAPTLQCAGFSVCAPVVSTTDLETTSADYAAGFQLEPALSRAILPTGLAALARQEQLTKKIESTRSAMVVLEPSPRSSFLLVALVVLIWLWRHLFPHR